MLDKDKLILIVYFGISGMLKSKAFTEIIECRYSLSSYFDESVRILVIPVRNSKNTKIEVINPKLMQEEEYKTTVLPIIEKAEKILKDFKNLKITNYE